MQSPPCINRKLKPNTPQKVSKHMFKQMRIRTESILSFQTAIRNAFIASRWRLERSLAHRHRFGIPDGPPGHGCVLKNVATQLSIEHAANDGCAGRRQTNRQIGIFRFGPFESAAYLQECQKQFDEHIKFSGGSHRRHTHSQ